jgi:sugar transferase (PEP-CTERM/EpsH1 system associated)
MKIFVLLSRVPYPLEKGDKLRAYHQVKRLSKKHDVTLCCLNAEQLHPDAEAELGKICGKLEIIPLSKIGIAWNLALGIFSSKPYQVRYFHQGRVHRKVNALIAETAPDHIYCQLIRAAEYVKNQHSIPKTIDYMDAFSKGTERRIQSANFLMRPLFKAETRRLLAYENIMFEYFEHKTIISEQDRDLIYHPDREQIHVVRNGVDTDYFCPQTQEKKYDLVFNGNMSYAPNIDSAIYLVNEVLPELWKLKPEATLLISGVKPVPAVKELASHKVTISGWVEDVRDSYAAAHIFIAPMQIGTGLQNKLLEAMAMRIPCVTSSLANNALGAMHGENIFIGDSPANYAQIITDLLNDPAKANSIATAGHQFVLTHFDWQSTTDQLEAIMLGDSSAK